ncbi:MAG TPA: XRE family transcriptional regulator [Candidatus Dormibacteraeota bacterium]|nr:XRE family transcriptional regulator [Candidatus Dormibacteraeota bacterium]
MARKKFRDLVAPIDSDLVRRARVAQFRAEMLHDLSLADLRRARQLTQDELATALELDQSAVSKLEHRTDLYLSTLRRFVEAMGGTLGLRVRFPDGAEASIAAGLEELDEPAEASHAVTAAH